MSEDKNPKNLQGLALWISMGLSRIGMGAEEFAQDHLPASSRRSFYNWAGGKNAPQKAAHPILEQGLGWKPGAVQRILTDEFVTESDVFQSDDEKTAKRASQLSDEELLAELTRRTLLYRDKAQAAEQNVIKIDATLHEGKPADKPTHGTVTPLGTRRKAPQYLAARTEIPSDSALDDSDE